MAFHLLCTLGSESRATGRDSKQEGLENQRMSVQGCWEVSMQVGGSSLPPPP